MTTRGNRTAIALGPGFLFWAPIGSTEPTNLTTAWNAAFLPIGYTGEGSAFSYAPAFDMVEVAEELDPLDAAATGREIKVSFSMAEVTADNYKRAMNGGTITITGTLAAKVAKFEPPELGGQTHCMLGFEAEDHRERFIWRDCLQTGTIETGRRKGADKGMIPAEFTVFAPAAGGLPFAHFTNRGLDLTT